MSKSEFSVAGLTVDAGQRMAVTRTVTIKDVDVNLPIFLLNGSSVGPTLVVTAGIHGGEYPCVEAAARLGRNIDPERLKGQLLIIPSANPIAFKARSIYVTPTDGLNLNRQFPGDPNGSFTQAWADWLFQNIITAGDFYIDMHGGDMIEALVPFVSYNITGNVDVDNKAKEMAHSFGIRAVLEKKDDGGLAGTTYAAAARSGVPGLLVEAGGQGVWNEEEVWILESGVRRVLEKFEMYEGIDDPGEEPQLLGGWEWLRSECDGLFYPAVQVGELVSKGQQLGRVADIFGETLQTAVSPVEGEILFLVTSLAMNEGDPLMAIAFD
ncbi:MAG: M14 family metallopeptidase [Rhodothermia bacterium]|nr:MAG: M14 family metallopeptidase [Rhodothermia bacterium]